MNGALAESRERLRIIVAGPVIWFAHFLLCYGIAAVWCAKVAGRDGGLGSARIAIAILTLLALTGIGYVFLHGWRRHRTGGVGPPHDQGTPESRHRALGFATALLAGLSAVATIYVALAAVFIGTCR